MLFYRILADLIALMHLAYVSFVAVGMILILAGILLHWQWVRNFYFRAIHFLMIAIVAAESLLRIVCPLTDWEYDLRQKAGQSVEAGSFVARWVHRLMFFDAPDWAFRACYCLFALAVLATLVLAPPRMPWKNRAGES